MLHPKDWPVGLTVHFNPTDALFVVVNNFSHEMQVRNLDSDRVVSLGHEGVGQHLVPQSYADLAREPKDGERSVLLRSYDMVHEGTIYVWQESDYEFHRKGGTTSIHSRFDLAPLAPVPAEPPARVGQQNATPSVFRMQRKPAPANEEPEEVVRCKVTDRPSGDGSTCAGYWFSPGSLRGIDPCAPCCTTIDRIESERARTAGRCPHLWPVGVACPSCPTGWAR